MRVPVIIHLRGIGLVTKLSHSILSLFLGKQYLPTPLLGQDMTQGQFLSGV